MLPWNTINRMAPRGTLRRRAVIAVVVRLRPDHWAAAGEDPRRYHEWIKNVEPLGVAKPPPGFAGDTLISIVVPCYNPKPRHLRALVRSVQRQAYRNWELCLADATERPRARRRLRRIAAVDPRIAYSHLSANRGIAGNTNEAIALASGEYVAFVDHDDELAPHALMEVALLVHARPHADLIYSDCDQLSDRWHVRSQPRFKPSWSPILLERVNFLDHLLVIRRSLLLRLGGLRTELDGSQDWDLALRATEVTSNIYRIPKILYHWRMTKGSVARATKAKPYALAAGERAVAEHLRRCKLNAIVRTDEAPGAARVQHLLPAATTLSLIVAASNPDRVSQTLARLIARADAPLLDVVVVTPLESATIHDGHLPGPASISLVRATADGRSIGALFNVGRRQARGEILVFLDGDTIDASEGWLRELAATAISPGIGPVAPLVIGTAHRVAHAGLILEQDGPAAPWRGQSPDLPSSYGPVSWPRNLSAVSAACVAITADRFDRTAGFDLCRSIDESALSLCAEMLGGGYAPVLWPFVSLRTRTMPHSAVPPTRGRSTAPDPQHDGDPYFNPNLGIYSGRIEVLTTGSARPYRPTWRARNAVLE